MSNTKYPDQKDSMDTSAPIQGLACRILVVWMGILTSCFHLFAQESQPSVLFPEFSYQMGIPAGMLQDRFGNHLALGGGINYQSGKSPLNLALRYSLIFGNTVKEDVLKPFRSSFGGLLIGFDQFLTELKLRERAYVLQLAGGGLYPLKHTEISRTSIKYQLGFGFFEHRIRFVDDASALPQFSEAIKQGLDRLSNGFALIPSIGYEHLSNRGKFSWYAGIEQVMAWTKDRRSYHYDLGQSASSETRLDIAINLKLAIYLPFYLENVAEDIEY